MNGNEPFLNTQRAGRLIRLIPAPILAAIAAYAALRALGVEGMWPEIAGAIAGGYLLGVIARRV
jgi:hypothetical protein